MVFTFKFFIQSIMLGIGLAMDAFSVSLANGLNEPTMKKGKMLGAAGIFAGFQAIMPFIGWVCVHTIVSIFEACKPLIPWSALILLLIIGGKMLIDGIKSKEEDAEPVKLTFAALVVQGVATSIDALSVGFTITDYNLIEALACVLVIGAVTMVICTAGLIIGKKFGTMLANKAQILGGLILIAIGLYIFISGVF